ncbi:MAG TPA: tRNA (guanosine(46)-N7)-methyltransferase TrmB [Pseudomonadaceae bacterium]|nr:tRNA (guanosine(46)-N7)-methyltransferase TrmB [Pseudomonadaceae bacterium]
MNDTADTYLRTIRSFVKRAGRMTGAQKQAMEQLWPRFGLELQAGPLVPAEVFGRQAPLVLEIGFGMGDSLIAMAQQHPEWDYVGVEVYPPGIGNLLKLAEADAVDNLRVYEADAKEVLNQAVADASLDRIQIFFPDPWHKKKHHKRRLIQPDFVAELRSKLKPGGILHLATDWEHYALQMMEVLSQAPGMRNCQGVGQWAVEHGRSGTKFERRGQRLGHGVWDLLFERID